MAKKKNEEIVLDETIKDNANTGKEDNSNA
jgi:hypothetical protein